MRSSRTADFGVAHGGRRIAVDRTEIALSIDQRQPHGKILRQPHQRVIHCLVAMRVIFADDIADDARGFAVRLVPVVAAFMHGIENAPVYGFEAVPHIGQRARDDDAHRIIEIGAL